MIVIPSIAAQQPVTISWRPRHADIKECFTNFIDKTSTNPTDDVANMITNYAQNSKFVRSYLPSWDVIQSGYAHWDGLGASINQITREMPAFAFSLNTGFMAISNNIPMLADQINMLNQRNKELRENGEKTTPVLKTILGSVLSWQTALSVGVTLLTVYGGKIIEWISKIGKSTDELKEKQEAYNKKVEENIKIAEELYEINKKNSEAQLKNAQNNLDLETKLGVSKSEIAKNELKIAEEKLKLADKAFSTFQKESNWNELRNQQAKQYIVTLNDYIKKEREKLVHKLAKM